MADFRLFLLSVRQKTPCFGENKNTIINSAVVVKAITGPDGRSNSTLKYNPSIADTAPKVADKNIIVDKRLVNK